MKVSPADINVGDRVRQNVDDGLNDLVQSIRDLGQLQPILVDSDWNLIAGRRRLRACELLGIQVDISITTNLEDAGRKLLAERDENTCRKDFTPSEAVEMSRRIESLLKPAAEQRMKSGRNQHTEGSAKFAEGSIGETREIAAAATGYSRESIRKAAVVKDAAEAPDAPAEVVAAKAEMDASGKIDPAYKAVKAAIQENPNVGALANTATPEEIASEAAELVELRKWSVLDDIRRIGDLIDNLETHWTERADRDAIHQYLTQTANELRPASNPIKTADGELTVDDLLAKVQALPRDDRKRFIGLDIQKTAPPRHLPAKEAELLELRLNQFQQKVDDNGGSASQGMIDTFMSEIRNACRQFIKSEATIPPSWKAVKE